MSFRCAICKKCKLPIFSFAACACKDGFQDGDKTLDEDGLTRVDPECQLTNGHFAEDAWNPGMIISTKQIVWASELRTCTSNEDVIRLLDSKGFTNFI